MPPILGKRKVALHRVPPMSLSTLRPIPGIRHVFPLEFHAWIGWNFCRSGSPGSRRSLRVRPMARGPLVGDEVAIERCSNRAIRRLRHTSTVLARMRRIDRTARLCEGWKQKSPPRDTRGASKWGDCGGDLLFQGSYRPSTIGAEKLNCCVRDGNRCGLLASTTTISHKMLVVRGSDLMRGTRDDFGREPWARAGGIPGAWPGMEGVVREDSRAISITWLNALRRLHR